MSIMWLFVIFGVIGIGVGFMVRRKNKQRAVENDIYPAVDIPVSCDEEQNCYFTKPDRQGVTVRSYGPVPSADALQLIENGIAHTIRNTADKPWSKFRTLETFEVFLVPPATHNVEDDPGSPALIVKTLDAAGIKGTIQAAGTCIGVPNAIIRGIDTRYPSIVLPFEASELPDHAVYLEESARNEAEHIEMWGNDRNMFAFYVGPNDQHPIFPDPAGS